MSRKKRNRKQPSGKQNQSTDSGRGRLLLAAATIAILIGAGVYRWSHNSAYTLLRIRELGQRDPAAAIERLDDNGDRSRDAMLLRSRLLGADSRWEQAEAAFEDIAEPELCNSADLIELASLALASGIHSLADKVLDTAYRQGNPAPQLLRTMIGVKRLRGADQQALALCDEMSTLAPRDPFPWYLSARIYHDAEKIDLAIEAYQETLLRDPSPSDARNARFQIVDLAIYAGDLETASRQLDILSTELPGDDDIGVLRARVLHRKGDLLASLKELNAVLASQPDMVSALLERGALHLELENFAEAVHDLKQAVALAPKSYTGHYKLGLAYQRLNQPSLAKRHLERSSDITDRIAEQKLLDQERRTSSNLGPTN